MPSWKTITLFTALAVLSVPGAVEAAPFSTSLDRFPYAGTLLDEQGVPMDGVFDVIVSVYEKESGIQTVVYQEFHGAVAVEGGRLSLLLGTGQSSTSVGLGEILSAAKDFAVEVHIDGESLGEPVPLGALPFAAYAASVPASGVLVGGGHGLLPEAAVPRTVNIQRAWHLPGDVVADPVGWRCEHMARIPETAQASSLGSAGIHGQDIFVAAVGPVTVPVLPGLTVDFSEVPGDPSAAVPGDDVVQIRQAFSSCTYLTWTPSCTWDIIEPSATLPVEVESLCIPVLAPQNP